MAKTSFNADRRLRIHDRQFTSAESEAPTAPLADTAKERLRRELLEMILKQEGRRRSPKEANPR